VLRSRSAFRRRLPVSPRCIPGALSISLMCNDVPLCFRQTALSGQDRILGRAKEVRPTLRRLAGQTLRRWRRPLGPTFLGRGRSRAGEPQPPAFPKAPATRYSYNFVFLHVQKGKQKQRKTDESQRPLGPLRGHKGHSGNSESQIASRQLISARAISRFETRYSQWSFAFVPFVSFVVQSFV